MSIFFLKLSKCLELLIVPRHSNHTPTLERCIKITDDPLGLLFSLVNVSIVYSYREQFQYRITISYEFLHCHCPDNSRHFPDNS